MLAPSREQPMNVFELTPGEINELSHSSNRPKPPDSPLLILFLLLKLFRNKAFMLNMSNYLQKMSSHAFLAMTNHTVVSASYG